jgi:hypothetical protein
MVNSQIWSSERVTGMILVFSSVVLLPGVLMFWFRGGTRGGLPPSPAYYVWERGFVAAWVILTAVGFVLLQEILRNSPGQTLAVTGATAYFIGSILLAAAEILSPSVGYGKVYPLSAGYVIIAFLAQAVLGGAILQSGLLAAWIGWASIVWNIIWLILLPLISPHDIYFPILHNMMPLVVGIALLFK